MESLHGHHEDFLLISYVPKKNKSVIMLSTFHDDFTILPDESRKPAMIADYNEWKCGVDLVDQMTHTFTTQRRTCRWPNVIFYNIVDLCALNAYETNNFGQKKADRRQWLRRLGMDLMKPWVELQVEERTPYHSRRNEAAKKSFGVSPSWENIPPATPLPQDTPKVGKRKNCNSHGCNAFVQSICSLCRNNCCNNHAKRVCLGCSFT